MPPIFISVGPSFFLLSVTFKMSAKSMGLVMMVMMMNVFKFPIKKSRQYTDELLMDWAMK